MKIPLSFATSCTAVVMGWSRLLANWIGDSHCTGGGSPCTLMKCPMLSHGGMQHWSAMCGSHGVRACLRPGMYHVLVLMELQQICGTGAQGDGSLLNALSRKCYMHTLQYVHRGTLP